MEIISRCAFFIAKPCDTELYNLFHSFLEAGLHGRFAEALVLIEEPYIGVGIGEQGMVRSKAEAELILQDGYRPLADAA